LVFVRCVKLACIVLEPGSCIRLQLCCPENSPHFPTRLDNKKLSLGFDPEVFGLDLNYFKYMRKLQQWLFAVRTDAYYYFKIF